MNRGVFGLNNYDGRDRPPVLDVVLTTTQTGLSHGSFYKALFDTVVTDTHGMWDKVNSRAIVRVAGFYQVNAHLIVQTGTTMNYHQTFVFKNGASYRLTNGGTLLAGTSLAESGCSVVMPLNVGDYIEMDGATSGTGTLQLNGSSNSWMQMAWLRGI